MQNGIYQIVSSCQLQWNLYRRPPAKGDHLPSRPLLRSPRRFLLYIAPAKGDHLSNATATTNFEGPTAIFPCRGDHFSKKKNYKYHQ